MTDAQLVRLAAERVMEHGILFSGEMVRALLDNRKTRTRRLSKRWLKVKRGDLLWVRETYSVFCVTGHSRGSDFTESHAEAGIGYRADHKTGNLADGDGGYNFRAIEGDRAIEQAGRLAEERYYEWMPSIHMYRWASRITLEATADARLERLRDITEDEAICEGLLVQIGGGTGPGAGYKWNGPGYHDFVSVGEFGPTFHVARHGEFCCCKDGQRLYLTPPRCAFRSLWQSLHTKPGERWSDNPEVVVLSFRRLA